MAMRPIIVVLAALVFLPSIADAQQVTPYVGPDGRTYYRGAADPNYAPPNLPADIMVSDRPRGAPRQRNAAPPATMPSPTPPAESKPDPLVEWCREAPNAKVPLCRNVGSPRVQR
jgi:hypothetical protein